MGSYLEPLPQFSTSGPSSSHRAARRHESQPQDASTRPIRHCPRWHVWLCSGRVGRLQALMIHLRSPVKRSRRSHSRLFLFFYPPLPSAMFHQANRSFPSFHLQRGQAGTEEQTSGESCDLNLQSYSQSGWGPVAAQKPSVWWLGEFHWRNTVKTSYFILSYF